MQSVEIDYLDGEFQVQESEPSTVQECIDTIGEAGVVDETTSNLRYRNKYPRVYSLVSKEVEKTFPRAVKETKTNKDGTTKDIKQSEMDHLRAYIAKENDPSGTNRSAVAALFTSIAPEQPLYVKGERAGGTGKVSQAALDSANGFIAAGTDKVDKVVEFIESKVAGYKVGKDAEGNVTPESLARGIMALNKQLQREAEQAAKASLAALG